MRGAAMDSIKANGSPSEPPVLPRGMAPWLSFHPSLSQTLHRPWPLPNRNWSWNQTWCKVLFAHWEVPSEQVRRLVPEPLDLDDFQGETWLGIVPFWMEDIFRRPLPCLPGTSCFCELNVRTYVRYGGKTGVYFLSLDAASWLAVQTARTMFRLPYYHASMSIEEHSGEIHYRSHRREPPLLEFEAVYAPDGPVWRAQPGTREHFLTERYSLFTVDGRGDVSIAEIHHAPWPLQHVQADLRTNTMAKGCDLVLGGTPHLLYSDRLEVAIWSPRKLEQRSIAAPSDKQC